MAFWPCSLGPNEYGRLARLAVCGACNSSTGFALLGLLCAVTSLWAFGPFAAANFGLLPPMFHLRATILLGGQRRVTLEMRFSVVRTEKEYATRRSNN